MGPRSMGAGTQMDGYVTTSGGAPGRTLDDYTTRPVEPKSVLTPAQRLIERYERLSTPPPPSPSRTPPGAIAYPGAGQTMMRAKSTRSRQYVYDFRTEMAGDDNIGRRAAAGAGLKKDRSPIRQSLKNLFSVLKKGAGGLSKLAHHAHLNGKGEDSLGVPGRGAVSADPMASKTNEKCDTSDGAQATRRLPPPPRKKMTGPLLYLSQQTPLCDADASSEEDIPACSAPVPTSKKDSPWAWSTCSVTLEEGKLVVSCFTGDLELYVREIMLARCADIRSLSAAQLDAALKEEGIHVLRSNDDKDGKVFEMSFSDGRCKERFAAKSVRERAGWISAIWDAILPSRDIDDQQEKQRTLGPLKQDNVDSRRLPVESPTPTPLPRMSSLLNDSPPPLPSKSHTNAPSDPTLSGTGTLGTNDASTLTLPVIAPLVPHKKPPNLHLDLSEFSGPMSPPSVYPPTVTPGASQNDVVISPSLYGQRGPPTSSSSRPTSVFVASPVSYLSAGSASGGATPTASAHGPPPNSPSIRNLSQLSVVRQRLAQIQRNHSELSGESRYSCAVSVVDAAAGGAGAASTTSSVHLRARGVVGTPSPISPVGSGWSKSEAVFYRKGNADSRNPRSCRNHDRDEKRKEKEADGDGDGDSNAKARRLRAGNSHRDHHHRHEPDHPAPNTTHSGNENGKGTHTGPSKEDIRRLSKEVTGIRNVLGGESGCATVHEMVMSLEHQMQMQMRVCGGEKKELRAIEDELRVLGERVSEAIATNVDVAARIEAVNAVAAAAAAATQAQTQAQAGVQDSCVVGRQPEVSVASSSSANANETPRREDEEAIMRVLNEVKDRLSVEFPALAGKLQEIKDAQRKADEESRERDRNDGDRVVTMNNVGRRSLSSGQSSGSAGGADADADGSGTGKGDAADQKVLLDKLEEIRRLCLVPTAVHNLPAAGPVKDGDVDLKENLAKILSLIQEDSNKQKLLSQQQGDSVRYLNELNSWLEAFVNNGTSQIQGISNNVERLCNEIGCGGGGGGRPSNTGGPQPNLVNDIRQLVAGMKARDQNFTALQAAVHSLLEVLAASQAQHGSDSQAIAGLMDRQRHDQEVMFRAFTNEISGEIKGERIRFVDAMKEATAINVQLHVEQFKQELSKEVMAMTEEVGRLHREKQIVENQISDLFSFYSKHKKAEMPLQVIPPNTGVPIRNSVQEAPRANIPRSNRQRTLPAYPHAYPRQQ